MQRRDALKSAAALAAAALVQPRDTHAKPKPQTSTIGMVIYPQFTALDFVGPHQVLSSLGGFDVEIIAKSLDPVTSDSSLTIVPSMTLAECPAELTVLFLPGGTGGTVKAMLDDELLDFVRDRGERAEYVTSVCTGSLILGAAGLLRGYKAATHWSSREVLTVLGATPVDERVVVDRNRVTGGGVTAGIDFGLTLAAQLRDEDRAKAVQLMMEYAPAPPFKSGTPDEAGSELTEQARSRLTPFLRAATAAAERAKSRW